MPDLGLFYALIESSPDPVFVADLDGVIRIANGAASRLFNYPLSEIVGTHFSLLVPHLSEAHRESIQSGDSSSLVVGRIQEVEGRGADGSRVVLDFYVGRAVLDGVPVLTGIGREITAQKPLEIESERLLAAVQEEVEIRTEEFRRHLENLKRDMKAALSRLATPVAPEPTVPGMRHISSRESEVLGLILEGEDIRTVAHRLHISAHTVRNHVKKIYSKLTVHSHRELLKKFRSGLSPDR